MGIHSDKIYQILINLTPEEKQSLFNRDIYQEQEKERKRFVNKFTGDFILNEMKLEDYVEQNKDRSNFCYILERKLDTLGSIRGGSSHKFGIYKDKKSGQYQCTKVWNEENNISDAFIKIKKSIVELIDLGKSKDYTKIGDNKLSPLFKGKILYVYHPNNYLPIYSDNQIDLYLKYLNPNYTDLGLTTEEKKDELVRIKNNYKEFDKYPNYFFVRFLYKYIKKQAFKNG